MSANHHHTAPETLSTVDSVESVDRRGFLVRSAMLAATAAIAGSCSSSPFGIELDQEVTVSLSDYPELAQTGGVAILRGTNAAIALVNLGNDSYASLSLICPHQGGRLSLSGTQFVCPLHGARFAENGQWVGGHASRQMYEYRTSYDAVSNTLTIAP
jgi:nitrite reductase/ring-hydroxylating ferredoxin subunit